MRNQRTPTPTPSAREPDDMPYPISQETREALRDVDPIVSQWERLASMKRRSPDFLPLFSILIEKTNRPLTAKLRGKNAGATLDSLIKVVSEGKIPIEYERDARSIMRTLAYDSSQIPPRHLLLPGALSEEGITINHSGSSELRKGKLGDKTVAIKILRASHEDALKIFCKECVTWLSVSHPRILKLIAINIDPRAGQYSMVSEMMNGNIKGYITTNPVDLNSRISLLRDAAMGLHYLHERNIIHGDIKGHNILITNEKPARACLADFGLTTLTPNPLGGPTTITAGGTPPYMAPELLHPVKFGKKNSRPTRPADMYAFGMVIYEVLAGLDPFYDKKDIGLSLIPLMINGTRPIKPRNAGEIGLEGKTWELVKACWKSQSKKRPTIEMALAHLSSISESSTTSRLSQNNGTDSLKFSSSSLLQLLRPVLPTIRGLDPQAVPSRLEPSLEFRGRGDVSELAPSGDLHPPYSLPALPSPDDILPLPLPSSDTQINHPDPQEILQQWQRLGILDPESHDYVELLKRLLDEKANRSLALGFTGSDADTVLDIIDKALRSRTLPPRVARNSLTVLRKLAAKTGQLPSICLIKKGAHFQVEEYIFASGGFADVRRGNLNGRKVAVKTFRHRNVDITKLQRYFSKEAITWTYLSHPNILGLIGVNFDLRAGAFSFISEFMVNGNIMDYIRVNEADRICLLEDVTKGLRYLHEGQTVHGDLKGSNILIKNGETPQACISDFGFSIVDLTSSVVTSISAETGGTWSYMAPELLLPSEFGLDSGRPSKQGDIYAFGMLVYEVLTGHAPFAAEGRSMLANVMLILKGERPSKPENAEDIGLSRRTWDLVQRCWDKDRYKRPAVEEINAHFHGMARTSRVVPPGSIVVARGAESQTLFSGAMSSGSASIVLTPPPSSPSPYASVVRRSPSSQASANINRQVRFAVARDDAIPSAPIRAEPSLFGRLVARITGSWRASRPLAAPTPTQT